MPEYITREELDAILAEKFNIKNDIDILKSDISDVKIRLTRLETEIEHLDEKIDIKIAGIDAKIDSLKTQMQWLFGIVVLILAALVGNFLIKAL